MRGMRVPVRDTFGERAVDRWRKTHDANHNAFVAIPILRRS